MLSSEQLQLVKDLFRVVDSTGMGIVDLPMVVVEFGGDMASVLGDFTTSDSRVSLQRVTWVDPLNN